MYPEAEIRAEKWGKNRLLSDLLIFRRNSDKKAGNQCNKNGHISIKGRNYPTRVNCKFQGIAGQIVLDQIGTVDKTRLVKKLGSLSKTTANRVLNIMTDMFHP